MEEYIEKKYVKFCKFLISDRYLSTQEEIKFLLYDFKHHNEI